MGLSRDDAGRFLPDYVDEKRPVFSPRIPSNPWTPEASAC